MGRATRDDREPLASTTDAHSNERSVNIGISGTGASHKHADSGNAATTDTTAATVNRRGLVQVVAELANSATTLLLDDFHYIPAAIQGDVAQQLKDASSRGVRICVASVPHRADNIVRALPELRGRVLAIDLDYWSRADLLAIPRIGYALLGLQIEDDALAMFAAEAAGSPSSCSRSACGPAITSACTSRSRRRARSRSTRPRASRSCS